MTEQTKAEIISLLSDVNREGISNVIAYLDKSDYFVAHCHHHHRHEGGLAEHSLEVYHMMREKAPELSDESCRIVALLHDLCTSHKSGYNEVGHEHHGMRSVELAETLGLELHEDERIAISKHMHHVPSSEKSTETALWYHLHRCDRISAKENK